jgi:hypothetical protein
VGTHALGIACAALCAGCSVIYNVDNLPIAADAPPPDAAPDAPIDADPALLSITSVTPPAILEGTGAAGGRPALLVVHGVSLVGAAVVTVAFVEPSLAPPTLDGYDAAPDGTEAGVAVRIPVLTDLAAGATRTLRVTVAQGAVQRTIDVRVEGLDELRLTGPTATAAPTAQTYARIEIVGGVHFAGADPVRLTATGDIAISAKLDGDAQGATPGPHGCAGGSATSQGSCTPGGGGAGVNASTLGLSSGGGGGGGGFGAPGTGGSGQGGGTAGDPTGRPSLVPIVSAPGVAGNRGNGGGGGGKGLASAGGVGGGGGGVIYLAAGGDITVTGAGAIAASGGTSTGGSGGGGGGSGGAILLRAGGAITAPGVWLAAPGGAASTGATNAGGAGGVGRIRVDAAAGDATAMATNPGPFRGAAWAPTTPTIVRGAPTFTLRGEPGRAFAIRLDDAPVADATPGVDGTAAISGLALAIGHHQLCAVVEPDALVPESLSCVELYYTGR